MKVATTIAAIALFFTSAIEALTIVSPASETAYTRGEPIEVLIQNDGQESFTSAVITFAASCGSWIQTVPVGSTQLINLPWNVVGSINVGAQSGSTRAATVQINIPINSAPYLNQCGYPRANPCGAIPCPPRPCNRRNRRGCSYFAEEAVSIESFDDYQA